MIKIRRGLDLPINGHPRQHVDGDPVVRSVAVIGPDYHGMKPTMEVREGDSVKLGQLLFTDKKTEGVRYTAPGAGRVTAVNRGDRRAFQSVVIELDENEEAVSFSSWSETELSGLSGDQVRELLLESGLWTALRTRPYSKVPAPASSPTAIFITAMDTNPLAADPEIILRENEQDFVNGVNLLSKLTEGNIHVCTTADSVIHGFRGGENPRVRVDSFGGVHPAGNVGTHAHFLHPVSADRVIWHISYQDVIAVGRLFVSGRLPVERVIAIGGPQAKNPRLVNTRIGASLTDLLADECEEGKTRFISGSVFGGRRAQGAFAYLGRYHLQTSLLAEQTERDFLHYLRAGSKRHSVLPIYLSSLFRNRRYDFTTSTGGSERAMVPLGSYEKVMPLDILPTQLLRALIVGDTETAQNLGCLELDEEDLALCTYVCPGKYEYGPILRDNLTRIELEG